MKYIRTENGHIYEYVEQRIYPSQYQKFGLYRHNLNSKYEQIIAQADTIEELCDCFVNVSNVAKSIRITGKYHLVEPSLKLIKGMSGEQFGAIWTSAGLIYVAKMNDKGELELI